MAAGGNGCASTMTASRSGTSLRDLPGRLARGAPVRGRIGVQSAGPPLVALRIVLHDGRVIIVDGISSLKPLPARRRCTLKPTKPASRITEHAMAI